MKIPKLQTASLPLVLRSSASGLPKTPWQLYQEQKEAEEEQEYRADKYAQAKGQTKDEWRRERQAKALHQQQMMTRSAIRPAEKTNPVVNVVNQYTRELKYDLQNGRAPRWYHGYPLAAAITTTGFGTAAALDAVGTASYPFFTKLAATYPTTTALGKAALDSYFAAHGANEVASGNANALTALELTPATPVVVKGFQYASDIIPRIASFGVSNHTRNWTQFGNNIYRLKPGYVFFGMPLKNVEKRPISYGYDRTSIANAAKEEFTDEVRRPLLVRQANEDNILADALNKTINGTSETRFGTGTRTLTEPGPHEVLTGTYWDLKTGLPVVRGSGLLGTEPIPVTATEGTYKSSGNFGNMSSVTNSMLGGGKYGFRNWNELEDYVLSLDLNKQEFNYIADLINRTKSFENGLLLGPRTTQGLISKSLKNKEALYQQYLADQAELSDWLMGNMNFGAKNQRVVYSAPKPQQIIVGQSDNPGFATRTANIGMELNDFTGRRLLFHQDRGVPKEFWPNGMQAESYISKYNVSPTLLRIIYSSKYNPNVMFPLHFRGIGPNPFPGMTTMQVKGIRPTFKRGGKIKVSTKKNLDNSN